MIDSHCHIGFDELKDNVSDIVERASKAGIEKILTTYEQSGIHRGISEDIPIQRREC